ncbi:hypothetical protein HYPBUDRAFT_237810 [Hyphopichia burtonii NRRL Y-1933]|uniref:Mediator of RNA polymerase II transcription subunit 13 n=1 Tax=Hyphopichia burtonii NRRL Y-1933 TaxID=984485 RepID=A0A1E4RBT8_9ASCO|nr:hypothetical protein HYPBUDRAFT_237810 [Hyphopichia burtonii NRRL Y-1933]ODV64719.1 hypothetical protein HYPBUDRAFT_237810 [Hyphopichia burtonii NRRL Y-1933]
MLTESLNASRILTNFYKLGHLSNVSYTVYGQKASTELNDQSLLELELSIRYDHPRVLVTYYNKCLYQFVLTYENDTADSNGDQEWKNEDDQQNEQNQEPVQQSQQHNTNYTPPWDLSKEYPRLEVKFCNNVPVDYLSNPNSKSIDRKDEYLAYASLSFLKAIKKLVLYNLSLNNVAHLFGNHAVVNQNLSNSIIHIDPILLPNGDLLLSISTKRNLSLFNSSIVDHNDPMALDSNFIIYLIPSGIRCHLYDNVNKKQSFTYNPPKNCENLIKLIRLSTGVDLSNEKFLWVKLIPNLQHLNNQTSNISKFVHLVDNKKFILWPWKLCLLQFGYIEKQVYDNQNHLSQNQPFRSSSSDIDPLGLISDFMDFSISTHQSKSSSNNFTAPSASALSTGPNSTGPTNNETGSTVKNEDHLDMTNSMMNDIFDISMAPNESMNFFQNETKDTHQDQKGNHLNEGDQMIEENQEEQENQAKEEDQLDDLFGDDSSDEDQSQAAKPVEPQFDNNFDLQPSSQPIEVDEENKPIQADKDSTKELDLFYETQQDESKKDPEKDVEKEFKEPKPRSSTSASNSTYIDIPKDQMTIAPLRYLKTQTPQVYDDPGAPLPIVPTPIIPSSAPQSSGTIPDQKNSFNDLKNLNFYNNHLGHIGSSWTPSGAPEIDNKSVFSPLLFNPIIKSNIDTKYGKGGKFYVDKELSAGSDSESKKRKLRATSVSGYEYPAKKEDRGHSFDILNERGLGIIRSENQDRGIVSNEDNENAIADDDDPSDQSDDDEEEDDDDEESDEDEDINQNKVADHSKEQNSPPLKLNTDNDQGSSNQGNNLDTTQKQLNPSTLTNTGGFFSPLGQAAKYNTGSKFDSPLGMNSSFVDNNQMVTGSPSSIFDNKHLQPPPSAPVFQDDFQGHESFSPDDDSKKDQSPVSTGNTPAVSSPSKTVGISESSNCLPLILRGINVVSIPSLFLLNNISGSMNISTVTSDFNMDVDEEENDFEINQNNELVVKVNHLDEFLKWLGLNLVFDLGLNKYESNLRLSLPSNASKLTENDTFSSVDIGVPISQFESKFFKLFPLCYKVSLNEFINEISPQDPQDSTVQDELTNQLSFLDDIANDDILNPKSQLKKLNSIKWDSFYTVNQRNEENYRHYKEIIESFNKVNSYIKNDEDHLFQLLDNKARVLKNNDEIINLNSVGLRFWGYLNYSPLNGPKNFQVLLISERGQEENNCNSEFLNSLIYNYNEGHFGNITKLNLQSLDSKQDFESINDGLLLMNKGEDSVTSSYTDVYKKINKRLTSLVELIKLDLINKTNSFEFDRPLLLFFVDFDDNVNSMLQISKICRNFKLFLNQYQLPLVEIFTHVIPASFIFKQVANQKSVRYLSNYKLSRISMTLYNKCPDPFLGLKSLTNKQLTKSLFTNLVKSPPSKLQFKFLSNGGKESTSLAYNDDIFLHLAYERTVDKNWVSAAWSDPFGVTTHVKSWYCSPTNNKKHTKDIYEMGEVIDEIWNISNELFKTLNAEIIKKTSGLGGKKFLVLTRINNVIPDDELVHWKRLSMKYKDVSLIVLSVNRTPRVLFNVDFTSNRDVSPDDNDLVQDDASNASSNNNVGLSTAAATIAGSSNSTTGLNSSGNTVAGQAQPSSASGLLTGLNQQQQGQQNPSSNIVSGGQKNAAPTGMGSATTPSAPGSAPDFFKNFNNFPPSSNSSPTTTGATMITSPSHNGGINFHSPQQFLNAPGNFLSPQDLVGTGASGTANNVTTNGHSTVGAGVNSANGPGIIFNESDVVLHDRNSDITAVIPRTALPSFTSPSKLGMKIGYLLKECGNDSEEVGDGGSVKKYLVYETTILSCSNFWKLDAIMKIMLEQYKKLISLNDILGLTEIQTSTSSTKVDVTTDNFDQQEVDHKDAVLLVPWHINAVGKSLDYLIHVSVEE